MENQNDKKEAKKKRLIICAVVAGIIIFLVISNFIVINGCAAGNSGIKSSSTELSDMLEGSASPSVCTKRTLFDVITNGLFHGNWE